MAASMIPLAHAASEQQTNQPQVEASSTHSESSKEQTTQQSPEANSNQQVASGSSTSPQDINNLPVHITAKEASAKQGGKLIYTGDVKAKQGDRSFSSDYAELDQPTGEVTAKGDIDYQDSIVTLKSDKKMTSNLNTHETKIQQSTYKLNQSQGRGDASSMHLRDNRFLTMTDATFTTCKPDNEVWHMRASTIDIDNNEVFGTAWNSSMWFYDVPVFYFPYLQFPVKNERTTGFLYPSYSSSSSNGIGLNIPFYWNIAPNQDATLTARYMSLRGWMSQLEYRYMTSPTDKGILYGEYLGHDKSFASTNEHANDPRWMFYWKQDAAFLNNDLRLNIDYAQVAQWDKNYYSDFDPIYGTRSSDQLQRTTSLGYYQPDWNLVMDTVSYQVLVPTVEPYSIMPRLRFNGYNNSSSDYQLSLYAESVRFDNDLDTLPVADRFHLAPAFTVPILSTTGYNLSFQSKLLMTHYNQQVRDFAGSSDYSNHPNLEDGGINRVLPEFRILGGMTFERPMVLLNNYTQTLEPQFQYLYIPYKNQQDIYLYDTTLMSQDYYSLFSDQRFSDIDRISDENRFSLGVTTRFLNGDGTERARLAVGQAYNFVAPRVQLYANSIQDNEQLSPIYAQGDLNLTERWFFHSGIQYNTHKDQITAGNSALEYRVNKDQVAQINYRYLSEQDATATTDTSYEVPAVRQLGGPLVPHFLMIAGNCSEVITGISTIKTISIALPV